MNKPKPTPKPKERKAPIQELIEHTMPFDEVMKRLVRVNPQEVKLPKR
jgi:hypothetical protein